MDKKERIQQIKQFAKEVIYCKEQDIKDKLSHFVGGQGKKEVYRGMHKGQKAFVEASDRSFIQTISFGVEMNTDFVKGWRKFTSLFMPLATKYSNVMIGAGGYLFCVSDSSKFPLDPVDIEKIRYIYEKLYQLARNIESSEKMNALATFYQIRKMQYERVDWQESVNKI